MSDAESWKSIPWFDGYEASTLGRIRSRRTTSPEKLRDVPLIMKQRWAGGVWMVTLCVDSKPIGTSVARLVCLAFRGEPPTAEHAADHIDGNRNNNCLVNLKWSLPKERCSKLATRLNHVHCRMNAGVPLKWSDEIADRVRRLYRRGVPVRDIASKFPGMNDYTVSNLALTKARPGCKEPPCQSRGKDSGRGKPHYMPGQKDDDTIARVMNRLAAGQPVSDISRLEKVSKTTINAWRNGKCRKTVTEELAKYVQRTCADCGSKECRKDGGRCPACSKRHRKAYAAEYERTHRRERSRKKQDRRLP